jgi:hypothetical protein
MDSTIPDPPVTLTVSIPAPIARHVDQAIKNANARLTQRRTEHFCTDGLLTRLGLIELLLRDVAETQGRPDGWEADSMSDLLLKHGYDVTEMI